MSVVVDASVAFKWYVIEPDTAAAWALREGADLLVAPDLVIAEVCSAAWKSWRRGALDDEQRGRIAAAIGRAFDRPAPLGPLAARAAAIARELDHPVYDCFYLALSEAEEATLVTADRRLLARVQGTAFESRARPLTEPD